MIPSSGGWALYRNGDKSVSILQTDDLFTEQAGESGVWITNLPLGLGESTIWRACDQELKRLLDDSDEQWVVPPPVQSLLAAPSFVEANMLYLDEVGRELSVATWALVPGVQRIRAWAESQSGLKERLVQCHPERILMNLNGQKIYQHPGTRRGLRHRLDLLSDRWDGWMDLYRETKENYRRNEIEEIEILHLLTLAHAAGRLANGEGRRIPESPERDADGFPMAICDL